MQLEVSLAYRKIQVKRSRASDLSIANDPFTQLGLAQKDKYLHKYTRSIYIYI